PVVSADDKAEAYGTAGLCYQDSAKQPAIAVPQQEAWHRESIRRLRTATTLAPKDPWCWTWHQAIGEQAIDLLRGDPKKHAEYYAVGQEHLEKAEKALNGFEKRPDERFITRIQELQKVLAELNPSK